MGVSRGGQLNLMRFSCPSTARRNLPAEDTSVALALDYRTQGVKIRKLASIDAQIAINDNQVQGVSDDVIIFQIKRIVVDKEVKASNTWLQDSKLMQMARQLDGKTDPQVSDRRDKLSKGIELMQLGVEIVESHMSVCLEESSPLRLHSSIVEFEASGVRLTVAQAMKRKVLRLQLKAFLTEELSPSLLLPSFRHDDKSVEI